MHNSPLHAADHTSESFFRVPAHYTRWYLLAFYFLAVLWGIRSIYRWQPSPLDSLFPFAMLLLLVSWALVDSRQRGTPIPLLSRSWFVIFAWYLIPMYFLWSRGWRGAWRVVLAVVLWAFVGGLTMYLGGRIAFGEQW